MKLSEIRIDCKKILNQHNIDTTDADHIIAQVLNRSVTELFIDFELSYEQKNNILFCIEKRCEHIPVNKIFGLAYFYGMEFCVDFNVLSPRPETEILVDKALDIIKIKGAQNVKVLDLCCGSGAIACAIKNNSEAYVCASDISDSAIKFTTQNAKNYNLEINIIKSDMFNNINETFDVIVSNPPYIETETCSTLDDEVKNCDPIIALDGGVDGLDFYREIANNFKFLNDDGVLLLEIGFNQAEKVKQIFESLCKKIEILKDYNGLDRVVVIYK